MRAATKQVLKNKLLKAIAELDHLCRPRVNNGKRYARFNPVTAADGALFKAVLAGEHALQGFATRICQRGDIPSMQKLRKNKGSRVCEFPDNSPSCEDTV
ncbi:MAG: hypothetical protein ONB46_14740 [candidate division KSB1 bacterium]|nr:hypothetical protein [candidate division KSB1 bacterium]MDZ7367052.1 hypothetical protein [candidate division KSB1 bacterium]MDZ7406752.1 hypothetical protein [candidate division KSB1 bacterium]